MTDSTVTSESGDHVNPITVRENVLTESAISNDSGLEATPSRIDEINLDENNLTRSIVISEAGAKSTPIAVSYTHLDVYKRQE